MPEFTAVILAGGSGTRLLPFTEELPKSLLPVANKPILAYQLEFLEHSGFSDVVVVASKNSHGAKIKSYIETYRGKLRIDLEFVSEDVEETADALRAVRHKIKGDFVVMSGDLITDVPMHHILDVHRVNDAALTVLLRQLPPRSADKAAKPSKEEVGLQDFVALDEARSRLLLMASSSDLDEESMLAVRRSLVRRCGAVHVSSAWQDVHLYVFAHWVLDLLDTPEAKRLSSVKSELVPYLVKRQFNSKFPVPVPESTQAAAQALSHNARHNAARGRAELYRCHAVLLPAEAGYTARAYTVPAYFDMNMQISRGVHSQQPEEPASNGRFVHPSASIDAKATVGAECILGASSRVAEKTNVKRSVIGKHCAIGAGAKIANSILMDYVVVADGASLEKCVVGSNAEVRQGARLDDCLVGFACPVPQNSKLKGEVLTKDRD
eukprot:tig00020912_g15866.t1